VEQQSAIVNVLRFLLIHVTPRKGDTSDSVCILGKWTIISLINFRKT